MDPYSKSSLFLKENKQNKYKNIEKNKIKEIQ